jgi:hypothetical protein
MIFNYIFELKDEYDYAYYNYINKINSDVIYIKQWALRLDGTKLESG